MSNRPTPETGLLIVNLDRKTRQIRRQFNDTQLAIAEALLTQVHAAEEQPAASLQDLIVETLTVCAANRHWLGLRACQGYVADLVATACGLDDSRISRAVAALSPVLGTGPAGRPDEHLENLFLKRILLKHLDRDQEPSGVRFGSAWAATVNSSLDRLGSASIDPEWSVLGEGIEPRLEEALSQLTTELSGQHLRATELRLAFFVMDRLGLEQHGAILEGAALMREMLLSISIVKYFPGDAAGRQAGTEEATISLGQGPMLQALQAAGLIFSERTQAKELNQWNLSEDAHQFTAAAIFQYMLSHAQELGRIANMPEALQVAVIRELPKSKSHWLIEQVRARPHIFAPKALDLILSRLVHQGQDGDEVQTTLEQVLAGTAMVSQKLIAAQYLAQHFPHSGWQEKFNAASDAGEVQIIQRKIKEIQLRSQLRQAMATTGIILSA